MPSHENRAKIDAWIAAAPDDRVVETERHGDQWTTQAKEDGEVRYEETEAGGDEPELDLLARWCERQLKGAPRPPVKTTGEPSETPARKARG